MEEILDLNGGVPIQPGDTGVIIKGTGFGSTEGYAALNFAGESYDFIIESWTDTLIVATAPNDLPSGVTSVCSVTAFGNPQPEINSIYDKKNKGDFVYPASKNALLPDQLDVDDANTPLTNAFTQYPANFIFSIGGATVAESVDTTIKFSGLDAVPLRTGDGSELVEGYISSESVSYSATIHEESGSISYWVDGVVGGVISRQNINFALKLKSPVGTKVDTLGYWVANDGGGGSYVVVPPGTGTPDGGSYFDMVNGNQLQLIESSLLNLVQFGVVADGTNQDTKILSASTYANGRNIYMNVTGQDHSYVFSGAVSAGGYYTVIESMSINQLLTARNESYFSLKSNDGIEIQINDSGTLFKPNYNFEMSDNNFTALVDNVKIISLGDTTRDIDNAKINNNFCESIEDLLWSSDSNNTSFSFNNFVIKGNRGDDLKNSLMKIGESFCNNWIVAENIITRSELNGIYLGFVLDSGGTVAKADINRHIVCNNHISNINSPSDPGSAGSYAIYVSGSDSIISDNVIHNVFAADLGSYSNIESIYTKCFRTTIIGNKIINCANNQGGITVKGSTSTYDANYVEDSMVSNNIIYNESQSSPFNSSVGVYVQSNRCKVIGNKLIGMRSRFLVVNGTDVVTSLVTIENNEFINILGEVVIILDDYVDAVINNNVATGYNRTSSRTSFLRIGSVDSNSIVLNGNVTDTSSADAGLIISFVYISSSSNLDQLEIKGNTLNRVDRIIDNQTDSDIQEVYITSGNTTTECDSTYTKGGTGNILSAHIHGNDGILIKSGTQNLGTVPAGISTGSNILVKDGYSEGDHIVFSFDAVSGIAYLGHEFNATDQFNVTTYNSTGGNVDLTTLTGTFTIEKRGSSIETTTSR